MSKLKVISLFAGPGAGKSTTAAAVFARMKRLRFSVELVTEYAKELTWEKSFGKLSNQLHVLAEQNFRLARLEGQVEYAITDSPLPLSLAYCKDGQEAWLEPLVNQVWNEYENHAFILLRSAAPYSERGRNQTLQQAVHLDERIHKLAELFGATNVLDPDINGIEDVVIREVNHRKAVLA